MEKTSVQKLAGVLKLLVTITFICNLVALFLVPGCSRLRSLDELVGGALYFSNEGSLAVYGGLFRVGLAGGMAVWRPVRCRSHKLFTVLRRLYRRHPVAGPPGVGHRPGREHFHL